MSTSEIVIQNDTDLHHRIMKLNYLKEEQELVIKRNVRELVYSMHPSMMIRNFFSKITGDKEAVSDLRSVGLNLGKDFLISKLFGKGSLKGFISTLLVRKATEYVINNHPDLITKGITKITDYFRQGKAKAAD